MGAILGIANPNFSFIGHQPPANCVIFVLFLEGNDNDIKKSSIRKNLSILVARKCTIAAIVQTIEYGPLRIECEAVCVRYAATMSSGLKPAS